MAIKRHPPDHSGGIGDTLRGRRSLFKIYQALMTVPFDAK